MKIKIFIIAIMIACLGLATTSYAARSLIGKEDLHMWDGVSGDTSYTRTSSGGYSLTLHDITWVGVDVLHEYGASVNQNSTTLQAALTAVGTSHNVAFWMAPGTWSITSGVTIPDNVALIMPFGVVLSVSTGKIVTFSSPRNIIATPNQQIFAGSGTIAFTDPGVIYTRWWGTDGTAMQQALTAMLDYMTVFFPTGSHNLDTELSITSKHRWVLQSEGGTWLNWTGAAAKTMLTVTTSSNWKIEGVNFNAADTAKYCLYLKATAAAATIRWGLANFSMTAATEANLKLGDYDLTSVDTNVAVATIEKVDFWDSPYGVLMDTINLSAVNFIGCRWEWVSGTAIDHHIYAKRAANFNIYGGYMGFLAKHNTWAIKMSEGIIGIHELHSEAGIAGDHDSGFLKLEAPVVWTTTPQHHLLDHCIILCNGIQTTGYIIQADDGAFPLISIGSIFRDSVYHGLNIHLSGTATYHSYSNTYLCSAALPFSYANTPISIGDKRTTDGVTWIDMPFTQGVNYKQITSGTTLTSDFHLVAGQTQTGNITLTLPEAATCPGQEFIIYKAHASNTLTIVRSGTTDIIGYSGTTNVTLEKLGDTITLRNNAYDRWVVISQSGVTTQVAISTGAGSVKMGSVNAANNAGWLEISPGKYVPYWTDLTP